MMVPEGSRGTVGAYKAIDEVIAQVSVVTCRANLRLVLIDRDPGLG